MQDHSETMTLIPVNSIRKTKIISELRQKAGTEQVVPFIRLRGRWLEQAGFRTGQNVKVEIQPGCLVLTPVES